MNLFLSRAPLKLLIRVTDALHFGKGSGQASSLTYMPHQLYALQSVTPSSLTHILHVASRTSHSFEFSLTPLVSAFLAASLPDLLVFKMSLGSVLSSLMT